MKPSSVIKLPKPDKRYKIGNIAKDKKGNYRGHPETVELKPMPLPPSAPYEVRLRPPLVMTADLVRHLKRRKKL